MADAESISLEETNKIRIKLGLKPLTDDGPSSNSKDKEAEDNYAKRKEQQAKERETSELATRIAKNRNKVELNRKLVGATLGDEAVEADTREWVKRSKKRAKDLAAKRQAELESRDSMFNGDEYTEKDLANVQVRHDVDDFVEGEQTILTLADKRVLDDGEDELLNVEIEERTKDKKRNELKTKRRDYTGYDDDEFAEGNAGSKRAVLAKYDEDINGAPQTGFRLGVGSATLHNAARQAVQDQDVVSINKTLLSIDYTKNQEISDYMQEGDAGFKKPKTKKKKSSRRAPIDVELGALDGDSATPTNGETSMDVDPTPIVQRDLDANFIDDDDLQASLARARRQKVRKTKLTPEDIARRIAEDRANEESESQMASLPNGSDLKMEEDANGDTGGLTFDDTTEFVRAISYNPVKAEPRPAEPIIVRIQTQRSPSPDVKMEGDQNLTELEVKEEGEADEDEEMEDDAVLAALESAIAASGPKAEDPGTVTVEDDGFGTSASESFSGGLAGTLGILRKQGIIKGSAADALDREKTQINHDLWLASHRHRLAQRELDRLRSRNSGKDQTTREYENRMREQQAARAEEMEFKNYQPDVDIKYYDEFGRQMTPKEAWKALSHRFHGKGSGRAKTEKRLKKIADEKKREAMLSGDTPTSMNQAFQQRQEKAGQAHMVLSVGNRGAVPQLEDFLDNAALSKAAKATGKGKGKKKTGEETPIPVVDITGFTNNPGLAPLGAVNGAMAPPSGPAPSMMKHSFARVTGESSTGTSGAATPVGSGNSDRSKVVIGFGMKRKAVGEDGSSTPPTKRR